MIRECRNCGKRVMLSNDTTDWEHNCNDMPVRSVINKEDVLITQTTTTDFDGTTTYMTPNLQGLTAENWAEESFIDGDKQQGVTQRGNNKYTHRQRTHYEFNELKKEED